MQTDTVSLNLRGEHSSFPCRGVSPVGPFKPNYPILSTPSVTCPPSFPRISAVPLENLVSQPSVSPLEALINQNKTGPPSPPVSSPGSELRLSASSPESKVDPQMLPHSLTSILRKGKDHSLSSILDHDHSLTSILRKDHPRSCSSYLNKDHSLAAILRKDHSLTSILDGKRDKISSKISRGPEAANNWKTGSPPLYLPPSGLPPFAGRLLPAPAHLSLARLHLLSSLLYPGPFSPPAPLLRPPAAPLSGLVRPVATKPLAAVAGGGGWHPFSTQSKEIYIN